MVNVIDVFVHDDGVTVRPFGPATEHVIVFTSAPGATVTVTVRDVLGAGAVTVGATCVNV